MITYNVDGVKMPKIKKRETTAWIKRVAASHGRKVGEIGYMFVDDKKILEVNNDYLGHDYYTDIITFDYDEGDTINRSEEHTSELQSRQYLVCRLLLEKKNYTLTISIVISLSCIIHVPISSFS